MSTEKIADELIYADIRKKLIASLQERLAAHDVLDNPAKWQDVEAYHLDNSRIMLQALLFLVERTP